jgi:hypothetical protein
MQDVVFEPEVHNKEYLLTNKNVLFFLAESSSNFATSNLASDLEILLVVNFMGDTLAHVLAQHQSSWMKTSAAKKFDILATKNRNGYAVAHMFAEYQPSWVHSVEAKDKSVLKITNFYGASVAQYLAEFQPEWSTSSDAQDLDILLWEDNWGQTVAHKLAGKQRNWLSTSAAQNVMLLTKTDHEDDSVAHMLAEFQSDWVKSDAVNSHAILMMKNKWDKSVAHILAKYQQEWVHSTQANDKNILCITDEGKTLAEVIAGKYASSKGLTIEVMALKLISQGAAYRSSTPVNPVILTNIFNQTKILIEDCSEPAVSLKYSLALFSTVYHCTKNYDSSKTLMKLVSEKEGILNACELLISNIVGAHPELVNVEHTVDIFCEPGNDALKRALSAITFMTSAVNSTPEMDNEPKLLVY